MAGYKPRSTPTATTVTQSAYMQAPIGMDLDSPAQFMSSEYAVALDNFIPGDSKITTRRPFYSQGDQASFPASWPTTSLNVRGYAPALNGRAGGFLGVPNVTTLSKTLPQLTNDEALWAPQITGTASQRFGACGAAGSGSMFGIAGLSGAGLDHGESWGTIGWQASSPGYLPPGKSYTQLFNKTFYVSIPTSANGTIPLGWVANRYIGTAHIIGQDSGTGAFTDVSAANGGLIYATSVKAYQSRLWVWGCQRNSVYSSTNLAFTNPLSAATTMAQIATVGGVWNDPISGVQNFLNVDEDESDPGLGMAVFNQRLILFRLNSIYILTGSTPANYAVQPLCKGIGCVDQESIYESDHGVYFVGKNGLMLTTGTAVTNVSGQVQNSLSTAIWAYMNRVKEHNFTGGISTCALANGDIVVSVRTQVDTDATQFRVLWSGVYSPRTNGWYRFSSALFGNGDSDPGALDFTYNGLPSYLINYPNGNTAVSIGNKRSVVMENGLWEGISPDKTRIMTTSPTAGNLGNGFDYMMTTGTTPSVSSVYQVPATWVTPYIPLSPNGGTFATLNRWFVDYLALDYGTEALDALICDLVDPHYESYLTTNGDQRLNAPSSNISNANDTLAPYGMTTKTSMYQLFPNITMQHAVQEYSAEMTHVMALIQNTAQMEICELYGIGLEFQIGREMEALN